MVRDHGRYLEIISRNVKSAYPKITSKIVTGFWEGYER